MRTRFGSFALGGACFAAALAGCSHPAAQAAAQGGPPPTPVDVTHAASRDLATYALFDGQVDPSLSSALSLQQAGTIVSVNVREGDRVRRGEVLAQIDDSVLRAQLSQNRAQVDQAQAHLRSSDLTTPINKEQLRSALIAAQEQLRQARNQQATADAALREARVAYQGDFRLISQGYVAQRDFETSRSAYVSAQQAVANARLSVAQNEAAFRAAKRNLDQVGVQAQDVYANRGALEAARSQVQLLATQVDQTRLRAPFDGIITARMLDPGAYAGPNQPIVQLSAVDPVYVNFNVPDNQLGLVRRGVPVSFDVSNGSGSRFTGRVDEVNAIPQNGTLEYRARVIASNPDDVLRGGMLVAVAARREYRRAALVVPRSSIGRGMDGGENVFVIKDGQAHVVPVKSVLETDVLAAVTSPTLRPGDVVVRVRPDRLMDGGKVMIASQSEIAPSSAAPPNQTQHVSAVSEGAQPQ